jgi:hypothetical protein
MGMSWSATPEPGGRHHHAEPVLVGRRLRVRRQAGPGVQRLIGDIRIVDRLLRVFEFMVSGN